MTRTFRYPVRSTAVEGLQGAAGFGVALGLLAFADPAGPVVWVLASLAALFLVYFGRAVVRYLTRIELDERGIRVVGPSSTDIAWTEMRSLRLAYYTTRSDRTGGWMQLAVRGPRGSIRVDSSLTDFVPLATVVAGEARRRNCVLDEFSRTNLSALGVSLRD